MTQNTSGAVKPDVAAEVAKAAAKVAAGVARSLAKPSGPQAALVGVEPQPAPVRPIITKA